MISDTDVERINTVITELRAAVEEELAAEQELRDFLLHHAETMSRALNDYQVRGVAGLENAFDQAIGSMERRGGEFVSKGYTRREAWKKFGAAIGAVAAVLAIPPSAVQIVSEVRSAIDGPSIPPVEEVIVVTPERRRPKSADPEHGNENSAHEHQHAAVSHS